MDSTLQNISETAILKAGVPQVSTAAQMAAQSINTAALDKTAQDFESMFMTQMLQPMFEGIDVDQEFGGGHGEETMRTFLIQEYGKAMSKSDGLGLAASVKNELIRAQANAKGHGTAIKGAKS